MQALKHALAKVERLAQASKLTRMLAHPARYGRAILFRHLIYPRTRRPAYCRCTTFFGEPMTVALPAGTDIYLTGGKSHDSEIRLARYFINTLSSGDQVLDIGAHFGYFTLLAAHLVGPTGKVLAFEASIANYTLLHQNSRLLTQVISQNQAVSDKEGALSFYQFPMQFSEYNSREVGQYEQEAWFQKYTPEKITVPAVTIDAALRRQPLVPKLIKIDVEGGEWQVIKGAEYTLTQNSPALIMEYLAPSRNNQAHRQAAILLRQFNYLPNYITPDGTLLPCPDPDNYLSAQKSDSDNLVFLKETTP